MFCWEALKSSFFLKTLSAVKSYHSSNEVSEKHELLWMLLFPFHSHNRLIVAVSYNLWISADHRCWLVSWGVFLIKRQMSGEGRFTLWHYKSWHHFKILCLLCCLVRLREILGCKEQHISPKLLTVTGEPPSGVCATFPVPVLRGWILWGQEGCEGWFGLGKGI